MAMVITPLFSQETAMTICVMQHIVSIYLLALVISTSVDLSYGSSNTDEDFSNKNKYYDMVPTPPIDSPYPFLIHERDVIRHIDLRNQFLWIGDGTHAEISLAEIPGLRSTPNEFVVVKTFKDSSFSQIMREVRLHRHVENLNITPRLIGLLPTGTTSSNISLVFEYIPYSNALYEWMDSGPSMSTQQWLYICSQMIQILRLIHSKDLIFNDLHRGNFVIQKTDNSFRVYIIDFGLATYKIGRQYSNTYGSLDNYTFIGPEAKTGVTTKATDIYALGHIFHKVARKIKIPKLLWLSQWCMALQPEDRPSWDAITFAYKTLFFENWLISLQKNLPNPPEVDFRNTISFDMTGFDQEHKSSSANVIRSTEDLDARLAFLEEPPIWKWLMENKHNVYSRCPTKLFVLDYYEVMLNQMHLVVRSSRSNYIILSKLNSSESIVIVKQFNNVHFSYIRSEACVTAFLGEQGITPQIIGILPGPEDTHLDNASFVQEYFGSGISLANFVYRVNTAKNSDYNVVLLQKAATDLFSDIKPDDLSTCYDCCPFSHSVAFWDLLSCVSNTCRVRSHKEKLFESTAISLTKILMLVHKNRFLVNNMNKHNILINWNVTLKTLDVKLIDLNSVTNLDGVALHSKPKYLSQFHYLAPEVVNGERSSQKSDIYSLCTILYWMLSDYISNNSKTIHINKWSKFDVKSGCYSATRHWSKARSKNQSECSDREEDDRQTDSKQSEIMSAFRWQKLEVVLLKCLRGFKETRPSLSEILDILNSI